MSSATKSLLVPLKVEALVIEQRAIDEFGYIQQPNGSVALGNGCWLPAQTNYKSALNRLDSVGPAPFSNLPAVKSDDDLPVDKPTANDTGVYLHWVLPTGMRRNHGDPAQALQFPSLPDQWLIVRFQRGVVDVPAAKAWFVDAGVVIEKPTDAEDAKKAKLLQPDKQTKSYVVQTVGKNVALDDYQASDFANAKRVATPHTAVGNDHTGSPTFTAYVADNRNILSWHDSLNDLSDPMDGSMPAQVNLSYMVLGWYRDAAQEPLRLIAQSLKEPTSQDILDKLSWQLGDDDKTSKQDDNDKPSLPDHLDQWQTLFHGLVAHINYWDDKAYGGGMLGYPGAPGAHGDSAATQDESPKVSIGHDAADALVALVAENSKAHASDQTQTAELWKLLEAAVYRKLPAMHDQWQDPIVDHAVHQNWFADQSAGFRWRIQAQERDANTLAVTVDAQKHPDSKAHHPQATQAQLDTLHQLNLAQKQVNQHARHLVAAQHDLYVRWWSLASTARQNSDPLMGDPSQISAADQRCQPFADAVQGHKQKLDAAHQTRQTHHDALQKLLDGSGLELRHEMTPRFYQPAEPVLIFQNMGHQKKHHEPQKTVCRPGGAILTGLELQIGLNTTPQTVSGALDVSQLQKDVQTHFAQAGADLSQLLAEGALLEAALTQLAVKTRQQTVEWPGWLAQIKTALEWDGKGHGPPQRIYGTGQQKTGALSVSRLASLWGKQPWTPLYLDWQVVVYKSDTAVDKDGSFGQGWQFGGYEYTAVGDAAAKKLQVLQGRSLLNPMVGRYFTDPIDELLDLFATVDGTGSAESKEKLSDFYLSMQKALSEHVATWRDMLTKLETEGLVGQSLSGFHQTFLSRTQFAPSAKPNPSYPWITGSDVAHGDDQMHQQGLLQAPDNLLPQGHRLGLPALAPHSQQNAALYLPFDLLRSGTVVIEHLRLVDDFGQWVDVDFAGGSTTLLQSPHTAVPQKPGHVALPPRIVQPTRFHFRFASRDFEHESHQHPQTHPVCGWVIHNYLDQALMICDPDGKLLGEIVLVDETKGQTSVRWESLADPPPADLTPNGISEPTLRAFVQQLVNATPQDRQPLQDLLNVIDRGLAKTRPSGSKRRYRLAGRPLALLNLQVGLHLFGQAWQDPTSTQPPVPTPEKGTGDAKLDQLNIPVQLGQPDVAEDGLLGYFLRQGGGREANAPDMGRFFPTYMPGPDDPAPTAYLADPAKEGVRISFTEHAHLTLLMDPHGTVHGATGIVPAKSITPPAEWLEKAKENLELSFRVAPVLRRKARPDEEQEKPATTIQLSTPGGYKGQWRFHGSAAGQAADLTAVPPMNKPDFSDTVPQALEGRLVLRPEQPKTSKQNTQK
jgi:hypothetical protein